MYKIKKISIVIISIFLIGTISIIGSTLHYNVRNRNVLIFQLGQVVDVIEEPGIFFTIPFIQSTTSIFTGERLYDIPTTNITTSDKKSMIANCYATWQIVDTKLYYQNLSSVATAEGRLNTSIYSAMKNVMSSTTQDELISGKDGTLGETIKNKITNLANYGITVTQLEVKVFDLPDDNKEAVYTRMISERNAIAAQYTAEGQKNADNIKAEADAQARTIVSNAQAEAADIVAAGEQEYYSILADAYGQSEERRAFYQFWMGLQSLEESLQNGGTIVIDESSPIYELLINNN